MQITFDIDTSNFNAEEDRGLYQSLRNLWRIGCFPSGPYLPEVEKVTCRTPSAALRYLDEFALGLGMGISPEGEAVFLKNPYLGLDYLATIGKKEFSDPKVQAKFREKLRNDAELAMSWALTFETRLEEEDEEVFRKDLELALDYAKDIIKGKFSDRVHGMLVLRSYENLDDEDKRLLTEYIKFAEGK